MLSNRMEFFWCPFCLGGCPFFCLWVAGVGWIVPLLHAVAGKIQNFCNPAHLLGLRVLQPNTPFLALGCCNAILFLGL